MGAIFPPNSPSRNPFLLKDLEKHLLPDTASCYTAGIFQVIDLIAISKITPGIFRSVFAQIAQLGSGRDERNPQVGFQPAAPHSEAAGRPCPHRTGAPHHPPAHCPGRAGRRLDRGGGGCRVAPPDRGQPPGAGAPDAFRRPDSPDPAIGLVRQLVNGSGISRGAEPEARSRSDVGTRRDDRRDARGRGRRGREQRRRE